MFLQVPVNNIHHLFKLQNHRMMILEMKQGDQGCVLWILNSSKARGSTNLSNLFPYLVNLIVQKNNNNKKIQNQTHTQKKSPKKQTKMCFHML